jgi:hypothetical protein
MWKSAGRAPSLRVFTLAFALQLRKKYGKTTVRVRETSVRLIKTSVRVQYTYYQETHTLQNRQNILYGIVTKLCQYELHVLIVRYSMRYSVKPTVFIMGRFWHVYVSGSAYFVWPWISRVPYRTIRDVTPGSLSATDTYIVYHVTHFEASRNLTLHTRYVSTYVGAGCGRGRKKRKQKLPAVAHVIIVSCYKYGRYRHWCR